MKKYFLFAIACLWIFQPVAGQMYDPLHAPNSYQSAENPNYWKNRKPFEGYWQQDVHYTIKAKIDEKTDIISGNEKLVYTNNSPDTLAFVYFHLYQNAFQPGSYYENLENNNGWKPEFGEYEAAGKGTEIEELTVNGQATKSELDNTILKVDLPSPLLPGMAVTFDITFKTYFDSGDMGRRMKIFNAFGNTHYDGVHWYPRISVYDRKFGWTTDQHLSHEFYGDFGCFDVELDFASNYIVGATGFLENRGDMLPDALMDKLNVKRFAEKPWNSTPEVIIPYDSLSRKVWKYHAENVHDFAFTADPTYRIGVAEWNGIKCYSLVQEPHASGWQNAAEYTAKIVKTFSQDFGMYTYHKMIVADARDGMEYPMLTLDGGADPGYRSLLVHEVGHNWFFGQVGNNETYRAALDEGFTQFLTAWGMEAIDGDTVVRQPYNSKYLQRHRKPALARDDEIYNGYMWDAIRNHDPLLNTHSDGFNADLGQEGGYGHVYYKTATMLYNLQYVLGDELFSDAMKHYFSQWKIAHPYFDDFRNSIIQYTHVDLNWFFDQWLASSKRIDYAVKGYHKYKGGAQEKTDPYQYVIKFKRKGNMQMPIDFRVTANDGKQYDYHIPNGWFEKKTDATILKRWIGWDNLQPNYDAIVTIPSGIKSVRIDTTNRLADVYMLDNHTKLPVKHYFDHHVWNASDWKSYEIFERPELWWNGYDGFKAGIHVHGNYMRYKHVAAATVWFNTGLGQNLSPEFVNDDTVNNEFDNLAFRLSYRTGIERISKNSTFEVQARNMEGLTAGKVQLSKTLRTENDRVYINFKSLYRKDTADLTYLLYPEQWAVDNWNNTLNAGWIHSYDYNSGWGRMHMRLRSSSIGSDQAYSYGELEVNNNTSIGPMALKTRAFGRYGTGTPALESALYLAGGNPEQMMENKYTRSTGFFDHEWLGYGEQGNNFHFGGGLNLRGYSGYLAPELDEIDSLRFTYIGNTGFALNAELEFNRLIPWRPWLLNQVFTLKTYLFADAGAINYNKPNEKLIFGDIRMDAGAGAALTIKRFGPMNMIRPLTVRFDVPFFLNRPPATDPEFLAFRWVLGVSRAF